MRGLACTHRGALHPLITGPCLHGQTRIQSPLSEEATPEFGGAKTVRLAPGALTAVTEDDATEDLCHKRKRRNRR